MLLVFGEKNQREATARIGDVRGPEDSSSVFFCAVVPGEQQAANADTHSTRCRCRKRHALRFDENNQPLHDSLGFI